MSFAVILPFLRPIEQFILDEEITEVMVNPDGRVFIEKRGTLIEAAGVRMEHKHLEVAVKNIARRLGDDISEEKPILDSRLPDGSRVAAVFSPCSNGGTTLTIRKFHNRWFSIDDLVAMGSLEKFFADSLVQAIASQKNVLISGGAGTGKTTLLNALANVIPDEERVIVVEETAEIRLAKSNVVRWEARGVRSDLPAVSIRDLVKASLRHRPDRLIVGEVRGAEAFDLLQALNTGHSGSLSTIHANTSALALTRLTNCTLEAGISLPYSAIRNNIAASIDLIVQIERKAGRRLVTEVAEVQKYNHIEDRFELRQLSESAAPLPRPMRKARTGSGGSRIN